MRTTLASDDVTCARLQREMRRRGCSFREVVNDSLRRDLDTLTAPPPRQRFVVKTYPGGPVPPLIASERHWELFARMVSGGQCTGPLVSDAHLAALTVEHGGHLDITDRDFSRFPGLRWSNPLAPE